MSSAKSHLGWSVRVIRTETPAYEFESVGVLIKPRYFGPRRRSSIAIPSGPKQR